MVANTENIAHNLKNGSLLCCDYSNQSKALGENIHLKVNAYWVYKQNIRDLLLNSVDFSFTLLKIMHL